MALLGDGREVKSVWIENTLLSVSTTGSATLDTSTYTAGATNISPLGVQNGTTWQAVGGRGWTGAAPSTAAYSILTMNMVNGWGGSNLGAAVTYGGAPSGLAANVNAYVTNIAAGASAIGKAGKGYTSAQTAVAVSSGVVANAAASAAMPAVAAKTNYVSSIEVTGLGATGATSVTVTLNNLIGGTTKSYIVAVPAGVTTGITPLIVAFNPPVPGSAVNTAVTLSVPAFGSGNTGVVANINGYVE